MSIAAFMYSQLPTKSVGEITEIIRVSETAYTVKGSGVVTIHKRNIDTGGVEQVQYDFSTGDYTLNHSQGQRFEVSADGVNWKSDWGVYLNGVDAYLEALDIDEAFLNADGLKYRKLGLRIINSSEDFFIASNSNRFSSGIGGIELLRYVRDSDLLAYINDKWYDVADMQIDLNEIEIIEGDGFYLNSVKRFDVPIGSNKIALSEKIKYNIGESIHSSHANLHATLFNIELGTHIAQMNGQGTQIINQNGEPFLNFKGGAEWVKI